MGRTDSLSEHVLQLYAEHRQMLADYPWEWEYSRWTELVIDVMTVAVKVEPALARSAGHILSSLGLLSPSALGKDDDRQLALSILVQAGIRKDQATQAVEFLANISAEIVEHWGQLQGFLRQFADEMASGLAKSLETSGLEPNDARKVAVLWLQTVANMPIVHRNDEHIVAFCKRNKVDTTALAAASDAVGLSLVVLDDLLAVEHAGRQSKPPVRRRRRK